MSILYTEPYPQNLNPNPIIRSYGKIAADDASQLVTTDTAFMLASVTKPFVAAVVAVLLNTNQIASLDEFICDKVFGGTVDTRCQNPNHAGDLGKITWRDLVTHRASLDTDINRVKDKNGVVREASYAPTGGFGGNAGGGPTCPLTDIENFYEVYMLAGTSKTTTVAKDLETAPGVFIDWYAVGQSQEPVWNAGSPGQTREYSNLAYGYIPVLVQKIVGKSFTDYAKEVLFDKLGMTRTGFFRETLANAGVPIVVPLEPEADYDNLDPKAWKTIDHYWYVYPFIQSTGCSC